jgi:hypothetical protein
LCVSQIKAEYVMGKMRRRNGRVGKRCGVKKGKPGSYVPPKYVFKRCGKAVAMRRANCKNKQKSNGKKKPYKGPMIPPTMLRKSTGGPYNTRSKAKP